MWPKMSDMYFVSSMSTKTLSELLEWADVLKC